MRSSRRSSNSTSQRSIRIRGTPITAPASVNGRKERSQHPYDMEALELFDPVMRRIYEHCATTGIPVDTLSHETGSAQLEVNLLHGDPLDLADQVVLFKRIARKAAQEEGIHATFMAKPIDGQAGSAMHLHVSLVDAKGENLFADRDDADTPMFRHFMGGLQKYIPEAMPLFAPHVNSYRRIRPNFSAAANIEWSHDNRSCGLRVPKGGRDARRVENRLPGADANPYSGDRRHVALRLSRRGRACRTVARSARQRLSCPEQSAANDGASTGAPHCLHAGSCVCSARNSFRHSCASSSRNLKRSRGS